MKIDCLIAEYASMDKAEVALEILRLNGYMADSVSVAWRGHEEALAELDAEDPSIEASKEGDKHSVAHSAEIGALLGGAVMLPLCLGSIVAPVLIAGPILGILGGAAAGGLFGELLHWGIPKHAAMRYDQRIADGSVLLIVRSGRTELRNLEPSLKTTDAISIEIFSADPNL